MSDNETGSGGSKSAADNVVRVDFGRNATKTKREIPRPAVEALVDALDGKRTAGLLLEVFARWIDAGLVQVTVDSRQDAVSVPTHLRGTFDLRLNFSHRFYVPDFGFDEEGVRATLSFQGTPFFCNVPWRYVWMVSSPGIGQRYVAPVSHHPAEAADELGSLYDDVQGTLVGAGHSVDEATRMMHEMRENGLIIAPPPSHGGGDVDDDGDDESASVADADEDADPSGKVIPLFKR